MLTKSQRASFDRFDRVLHRPISRHHDRDDLGIAGDGGFDDGGAVDAWQPQVGDDDVEGEIVQVRHGGFTRFGLYDLVAAVGQLFGDGRSQRGLVFDQQQMFRSYQSFSEAPTC